MLTLFYNYLLSNMLLCVYGVSNICYHIYSCVNKLKYKKKYLRQFKAADIKIEEQLRMRDSTLFSSQVLPTQPVLWRYTIPGRRCLPNNRTPSPFL